MTSEILRRLKCTSLGVGREKQERRLRNFMNDLAAMGYSHEWRSNVMESAMRGYCRILFNTRNGTTLRNRTGQCTAKKRRFMKLVGMAEWYKVRETSDPELEIAEERPKTWNKPRESDKRYIESIVYIPHTPGSVLKNNLTR